MKSRDRILHFIDGKLVDRLPCMPITMMFAADQIGARYGEYASDSRVLVKAQIATAEKFSIDYVSAISDPGREAADCGARINYFDDQPPAIDEAHALLSNKEHLVALQVPDPTTGRRMSDRLAAVAALKQQVGDELLVEGWIEGPCAEAADLRGINNLMLDFYDDPPFIRDLLEFVVEMELKFAQAQVDAGADLMGVGDAASSLVGPRVYEEFVWDFQNRLVQGVQKMGIPVRLHICGNTRPILGGMGRLGCEIVDLDYPSPMIEGRKAMGPDQVLLGNINPVETVLNGSPELIQSQLEQCWQEAGPRYIVGAGCEIPRGTPSENFLAMTGFARQHNANG